MAERLLNREELARRLGLPPRTVRRLVEGYRDWLSQPASGRFTTLDLARLQIAARLQLAGRPRAAIEQALRTTGPARPTPVDGAAEAADQAAAAAAEGLPAGERPPADAGAAADGASLRQELLQLRTVIVQGAEREHADRDRMLMALLRTQQEVSHLRSELVSYRSRRHRHSLLRRIFG